MSFEIFNLMACESHFNCSLHGQCNNGVCVCQVQFAGENCTQTNIGYTAAFGLIFSILGLIGIVQLIICIYAEYKKLKHPSICSAFRVTTQKLLLGVVIAASSIRVLYFSLQGVIPEQWLIPMESAYHPLLITGLSLVVCYWSEAFFIETASVDASKRAQFLSKSVIAFGSFNIVLYVILIGHIVATGVGCFSPGSQDLWLNGVFQAVFGILLFVVYVIFLAIGVEIFFKLRGAFTLEPNEMQSTSSNRTSDNVNSKEILKSRVALIFQALLTLLTVLCVIFEAAGNLWKGQVNTRTRSTHEIIYRIAEVGAVLWFLCVLWNSTCPEKLWFLNPRCLLQLTGDAGEKLLSGLERGSPRLRKRPQCNYNTFENTVAVRAEVITSKETGECWICYDPEREDAGGFISPCLCKGGMAQVHHNCLRMWLIQNPQLEKASCKVCKQRYRIEHDKVNFLDMLKNTKRSTMIVPAVVVAVAAPCTSILVFLLCDSLQTYIKLLVLGVTVLLELASFKILGVNCSKLYHVTRFSALRILSNPVIGSESVKDSFSEASSHVTNGSEYEQLFSDSDDEEIEVGDESRMVFDDSIIVVHSSTG